MTVKTTYDVEWYIKNKAERIESATQYEAHQFKLDAAKFKALVIKEARERADSYHDGYGAQGFMRWLANIILICRRGYDHMTQKIIKLEPEHQEEESIEAELGTKISEAISEASHAAEELEKHCIAGDHKQPLSNFYKSKNTKDGYDSSCKDCRKRAIEALKSGTKSKYSPVTTIKPTAEERLATAFEGKPDRTAKTTFSSAPSNDAAFDNEELDILIADVTDALLDTNKQLADLAEEQIKVTEKYKKLEKLKEKLERRRK
ncbi:MAG: hypothetical protein QM762_12785 [Chryseolinea sp.]